jgi:hypothetical protein
MDAPRCILRTARTRLFRGHWSARLAIPSRFSITAVAARHWAEQFHLQLIAAEERVPET